jgi:hypothetical protein
MKMVDFIGGSCDIVIISCTLNTAEEPTLRDEQYELEDLRLMDRIMGPFEPPRVMSPDVITRLFTALKCLYIIGRISRFAETNFYWRHLATEAYNSYALKHIRSRNRTTIDDLRIMIRNYFL